MQNHHFTQTIEPVTGSTADCGLRRIMHTMQRCLPALMCTFALILSGCAAVYDVQLDSLSALDFDKSVRAAYVIRPMQEERLATLDWDEIKQQVQYAFLADGMDVTEDWSRADYVALVDYGISDARTVVEMHTVPTYGIVGVEELRTITKKPHGGAISRTTVHKPVYGVTGSQVVASSHDVYTRYIHIHAHRIIPGKKTYVEKETWRTKITSIGSGDDFRRMVPIMLAPTQGFFGIDTHGKVIRNVTVD